MDALRRSVQAEKTSEPAARPARAKKGRKNTGQKEMLLPISGKKAAHSESGKSESGKSESGKSESAKKAAHHETGKARAHGRQRKAS
jgi:DNA end-binding protein Ku